MTNRKIKIFSFAMIALVLLGGLLAGLLRRNTEPFDIGDYSGVPPEDAVAAYEALPSGEKLAELCHVLCWKWKVAGEEKYKPDFLRYGEMLSEGAKNGSWDLEKLDNERGTLLKVLSVLREEGIR